MWAFFILTVPALRVLCRGTIKRNHNRLEGIMRDLRIEMNGRAGFITATTAMINGLKAQNKREDFTINMGDYGAAFYTEERGKITCFGCAATCAVQEYFGLNFNSVSISRHDLRADVVGADFNTFIKFERAVDGLRCGHTKYLSDFCALDKTDRQFVCRKVDQLPVLYNSSWEMALPYYRTALDEIMAAWDIGTKDLAHLFRYWQRKGHSLGF